MGSCACFEFRGVKKKFLCEKECMENNDVKEPIILKPLNDLKETRNEKNIIKKKLNEEIIKDEKETDNIIVINSKTNEKDKLKTDESLISINSPIHNINIVKKENLLQLKGRKEINIIIIGEKQSGKSSFAINISEQRFETLYIPTVFIEKVSKILTYNCNKYILNFYVTPGVQEYKENYSTLYSKANFILIFYDVSNKGSFNHAKNIIKKELKNLIFIYPPHNFSNIIIVGNKTDKCNYEDINPKGRKYCEKNNLQYFEISVKNNSGVGYMINKILSVFEQISS